MFFLQSLNLRRRNFTGQLILKLRAFQLPFCLQTTNIHRTQQQGAECRTRHEANNQCQYNIHRLRRFKKNLDSGRHRDKTASVGVGSR